MYIKSNTKLKLDGFKVACLNIQFKNNFNIQNCGETYNTKVVQILHLDANEPQQKYKLNTVSCLNIDLQLRL